MIHCVHLLILRWPEPGRALNAQITGDADCLLGKSVSDEKVRRLASSVTGEWIHNTERQEQYDKRMQPDDLLMLAHDQGKF